MSKSRWGTGIGRAEWSRVAIHKSEFMGAFLNMGRPVQPAIRWEAEVMDANIPRRLAGVWTWCGRASMYGLRFSGGRVLNKELL